MCVASEALREDGLFLAGIHSIEHPEFPDRDGLVFSFSFSFFSFLSSLPLSNPPTATSEVPSTLPVSSLSPSKPPKTVFPNAVCGTPEPSILLVGFLWLLPTL